MVSIPAYSGLMWMTESVVWTWYKWKCNKCLLSGLQKN